MNCELCNRYGQISTATTTNYVVSPYADNSVRKEYVCESCNKELNEFWDEFIVVEDNGNNVISSLITVIGQYEVAICDQLPREEIHPIQFHNNYVELYESVHGQKPAFNL